MMRILTTLALVLIGMACTTDKPVPNADTPASSKQAAPTPAVSVVHSRIQVVKTMPHDTMAFTQGLQIVNGQCYESTGQYGTSSIRRVDLATGRVLKKTELGPQFFGEGMTVLGSKIYMLTWMNQTGFIFDAHSLKETGRFRYGGEGWGLTTNGTDLIMSNGSSMLAVLDPTDFHVIRTISVTQDGTPVTELNELEFIEGRIWANVWRTDMIVCIDPATGAVVETINCSGLLPAAERTRATDVLNGIAYDATSKKIYLTGKNWPHVFEVTTTQ